MTMKTAKIQWLGNSVRVFDEATPERDLFNLNARQPYLIKRLILRAEKLGYSLPQIYPGRDGRVRIWL